MQKAGERLESEVESAVPSRTGGAVSFVGVAAAPEPAPKPERLGRYRVLGVLGSGGFGVVYRAYDEELRREVAVKVPHRRRVASADQAEAYLAEARTLALLDHPAIVPVYDVGRTDDGLCYVVSKIIEGTDLGTRMKAGPSLPRPESVALVALVAEALHHAHQRGLVHRDVKPANILLDAQGRPYLADFGLALRDEDVGKGPGLAGTPVYMSPEQARGEGHLVDARTDIYSLGVVLYELLTGVRPFRSGSAEDVLQQVATREPRPPRQLDGTIPKELDRICLKAVARRASDRYSTAVDFAEDLRGWLANQSAVSLSAVSPAADSARPSAERARVVPRGLRAFEATDADFFLELLPGPRDRDGLPDSIGFWKRRIEEADADRTFRTGLLYGPSGSGKSSLINAGLLPRLAPSVLAIHLESSPDGTEMRLARALTKSCPGLDASLSLPEMLASLRRGHGLPADRKLLIVLDQFEQWLHTHGHNLERQELVTSLRQADGGRVQCLLMIRDDFWVAATRLFRALEVRMTEDENTRLVDQFDPAHARHVLGLFGAAYGRLPANPAELSAEQNAFLDQAVAGLLQDGKVVGVRLSLFADLLKGRPWTPASLRAVGGTEGVGITFLEETFGARTAVPEHRALAGPVRDLLRALLPEQGADIKGRQRSATELMAASALSGQPERFARLLEILDRELHIVTPAEFEAETGVGAGDSGGYYQLTHDYLVPPLREWLSRKQRETWRGRAAFLLEERTAQWSRGHRTRFLPSAWEYARIRLAVPRARYTGQQRALMAAAARHLALWWGGAAAVLLVAAVIVGGYVAGVRRDSIDRQARGRVDAVMVASAEGLPSAVVDLGKVRAQAVPLLHEAFKDESPETLHQLHAACALAALGEVNEDFLVDKIADAPRDELRNIFRALEPVLEDARLRLHERTARETDAERRARYATALLTLEDVQAAQFVLLQRPDPSARTAFIHGFQWWHGDVAPLARLLRENKGSAFRSGMCAALAMMDSCCLAAGDRHEIKEAMAELYRDAPDGATHSAAGYALRRWNRELPEIERTAAPSAGRRWFANRQGLTMIEIPAGTFLMGEDNKLIRYTKRRPITLTRPFFLADREVSVALFQKFMNDPGWPASEKPKDWPGPDRDVSPMDDCPVQRVSWLDAVKFCNWLSVREGRKSCYVRVEPAAHSAVDAGKGESGTGRQAARGTRTGAGDGSGGGRGDGSGGGRGEGTGGGRHAADEEGKHAEEAWRCDFDVDGYRLPTEAEWEYACRAGSETVYSFGDDQDLLSQYGTFSSNRVTPTSPCGSKLPNDWGLFDMHGNVWEWCNDWFGVFPDGPATDPHGPDLPHDTAVERDRRVDRGGDAAREHMDKADWRVYRGGGVATRSGDPRSAARGGDNQLARQLNIGFRVACGAAESRAP